MSSNCKLTSYGTKVTMRNVIKIDAYSLRTMTLEKLLVQSKNEISSEQLSQLTNKTIGK